MIILRLLGGMLLLIAVIALVSDVTHMQTRPPPVAFSTIDGHWTELAPQFHATARASVERIAAFLWDPVLATILRLPTWIALSMLGIGFCYLGRRRRKVEIFAN